jgi:hypothetical protein
MVLKTPDKVYGKRFKERLKRYTKKFKKGKTWLKKREGNYEK